MIKKETEDYSEKRGLPPGSLVYVGKKRERDVHIKEINYSKEHYEEVALKHISESTVFTKKANINSWISVDGAHDLEKIESIGEFFKIDHLILEDAVNMEIRPKYEDLNDYLFLTMTLLKINKKDGEIRKDQLSLFLGKKWILSIDENDDDIFAKYRERLSKANGISRSKQEDFIFYRLIDIVVDNYFYLTDYMSDKIEELEKDIVVSKDIEIAHQIYELKKSNSIIRKAIFPLREIISGIIRSDNTLLSDENKKYFRDVYDHILQVTDDINTQRETLNDFLNLYMSGVSNRMNDIMKVLTMFSAFFIPLTFIAGIYGMNFEIMPELSWQYGYPVVWIIMVTIIIIMLYFFRKKRWL